ncbi:hypothetical protein IDH29_01300 [Pelagibacterales bacterium SAG-MED06]|nr:hypothetical protein [Pelagibacterales bacterium SAG-MED06]
MFFKKLIKISKSDFFNDKKKNFIRRKVLEGNIVVIRNHIKSKELRDIFKKLKKNPKFSKDTRMVEGIKNICYRANQKGHGKYSTNDFSWYFFPWNKDQTGLMKKVKKTFRQVIKLNKYDPNKLYKNTPKDRLVLRAHVIYYPYKNGHISLHSDPTNVTSITCGIYISSKKLDYDKGGFYVIDKNKKVCFVDHEIEAGDMILFYNGLYHGVKPTLKSKKQKNKDKINGRVFLNLSILESHEYKDRQYTRGLKFNEIKSASK